MNDEQLNDEQLTELCKKGEKHAFEELIQRYYLPLNRYFYKLLHDSRACEDLTHDVVIKLIRNIESYRPFWNAKYSTWLFKIAYNTYVDYLKKNTQSKELEYDEALGFSADSNDIHDMVAGRLERKKLIDKLKVLPPEMKSLIILRYINGFGYSDIGRVMGMSSGKVKWKLHNSIEKLRRMYKEEEGGVQE